MMMMHRVPTSPSAWMPRNQSSSQKNTITTGSTILSPKYIWLKPIPRRHLLSIPNRVPIRSQSSSWGCWRVGSSLWALWTLALPGARGWGRLLSPRCSWWCAVCVRAPWTGWGVCHLLSFSVDSCSNSRRWNTYWSFIGGVTADILQKTFGQ